MKIDVKSPGLEKLRRVFDSMDIKQQKSVLNKAYRKAVKPIIDIAIATAPVGRGKTVRGGGMIGGNLKASIGSYISSSEIGIHIGARKTGQHKGWHGHLVEDGTKPRSYITKTGKTKNVGVMPASGFFKASVEKHEDSAVEVVGEEWYKEIYRLHRRGGIKTA